MHPELIFNGITLVAEGLDKYFSNSHAGFWPLAFGLLLFATFIYLRWLKPVFRTMYGKVLLGTLVATVGAVILWLLPSEGGRTGAFPTTPLSQEARAPITSMAANNCQNVTVYDPTVVTGSIPGIPGPRPTQKGIEIDNSCGVIMNRAHVKGFSDGIAIHGSRYIEMNDAEMDAAPPATTPPRQVAPHHSQP